jgi:heme/copper-type cytochrome/quinol oxidase subunit 1
MRDARSFFSESLIVASWMMVAANPMLAISILMLLSDRHWQTSFFDYSGRGYCTFPTYVLILWASWSLYYSNPNFRVYKYNNVVLL